jgi:3-methyladenine DNA glycosylase AlkD
MISNIQEALEPLKNAEQAIAMSAYMRDQFAFLGIPTPARVKASKPILQASLKAGFQADFVCDLWKLEEREYQYIACDYLFLHRKNLTDTHLDLIEYCVTHKSWWDTIDSLDQTVGEIALRFPEAVTRLETWSTHENFWLRRIAIQHQLAYKDKTNQERLFQFILANINETEFFIRKSIGWALREYSYHNPETVKNFVSTHPELSGLSKREALKAINKKERREER